MLLQVAYIHQMNSQRNHGKEVVLLLMLKLHTAPESVIPVLCHLINLIAVVYS